MNLVAWNYLRDRAIRCARVVAEEARPDGEAHDTGLFALNMAIDGLTAALQAMDLVAEEE